jgi:hypothetical protein
MKTLVSIAVFVLLALSLNAQTLPPHFTGAGLGFQNSATPKASGWFDTCVSTVPKTYACLGTDYSGGTTSTRAEVFPQFYQFKGLTFFGRLGAGAATSVSGGIGGSFDGGGAMTFAIPENLLRTPGLYAVFSGSWQKRNVVEAPTVGNALQAFGSQTIWRFGIGKGW